MRSKRLLWGASLPRSRSHRVEIESRRLPRSSLGCLRFSRTVLADDAAHSLVVYGKAHPSLGARVIIFITLLLSELLLTNVLQLRLLLRFLLDQSLSLLSLGVL